jgi:hypothetical protein
MKRSLLLITVLTALLAVMFVAVGPTFAAPAPPPNSEGVTITLLDAPANDEIHLSVGETYTLTWHIESATPFSSAVAVFDVYYPGRVISYDARDQVRGGTSADLSLTITAKSPSDTLAEGYAPIFPVVAVRFGGQTHVSQVFNLKVYVTP